MELVEGESLAERLRATGPMSEREVLRLFPPLAEALQHAAESGVVHRDIKPANILLDEGGRARLVDLGLAFAESDPMLTSTGGTLGTPHYMSPEQARDPGAADTRSDIWSLGATLYHALCGRPPFAGESVAEILSGVLYHPIVDPRQLAPRISKGMTLVLRKCLARDPARRYSTPGELLADLERLRERRAPRVNARFLDPLAPRWPSWVPRSAALVGGLGLLVAIWLLNPWGASREDGGGTSSGSAPDWPELADVENRFAQGAIHSAAALALLEGMRLPEGWPRIPWGCHEATLERIVVWPGV
jgi:serine/threonine protein kinase